MDEGALRILVFDGLPRLHACPKYSDALGQSNSVHQVTPFKLSSSRSPRGGFHDHRATPRPAHGSVPTETIIVVHVDPR
jgi:hypothetical protein